MNVSIYIETVLTILLKVFSTFSRCLDRNFRFFHAIIRFILTKKLETTSGARLDMVNLVIQFEENEERKFGLRGASQYN